MPMLQAEHVSGLEPFGAALLFVLVLSAWFFPHQRAALAFTEAELTFLFPAPVPRRTLIHFKLLRTQSGILFTTLLLSFISNRFGQGGGAWIHVVGWWLILSTLNLHFLGASFVRTRLLDLGISPWRRRVAVLAVLAVISGAAWWWGRDTIRRPAPSDFATLQSLSSYGAEVLGTGAIKWLLLPFRWVLDPFFATSVRHFFAVLWPAALILVAHYLWVIRSDVAFEESSLALAQRRAELLAARRDPGRGPTRKSRRAPFVLRPLGPVAVAFLWKNLIGAGSLFTPRMWIILTLAFGFPAIMLGMNARQGEATSVVGIVLTLALVWSLLIGPQILRQDFRQDLNAIDVLKLYPLRGWRIVLGELLAPAVILSAIQWLLLLLLILIFSRGPEGQVIPLGDRLSVGIAAAMMCPILNFVSLQIPNAAILLFPAWLHSGVPGTPQGIEATGQRLIFFLGQLVVFALALVPAALVFAAIFMVVSSWMPWQWVVPAAALASATALLAEAVGGVCLLGKIFERVDIAGELRT